MKNTLLLLALFFYNLSFSQNYQYTGLSVISPNRDTLWLKDDSTGRLIAYTWELETNPEVKKPVILFVANLPVIEEKNKKRYIEGN
jgi:hypothetical protein